MVVPDGRGHADAWRLPNGSWWLMPSMVAVKHIREAVMFDRVEQFLLKITILWL